jgi:molybdate transport system substrate-binding protein
MRVFRPSRWPGWIGILLVSLSALAACTASPAPATLSPPTSLPPVPAATASPLTTGATALPAAGAESLTIFAASSLKDAFTEAGQHFKAATPTIRDLTFNFGGSQQLVGQLQQGAPADVVASADKASMDKAVSAGVIDGQPQELVRNVLTVVLPNDNPGHIQRLQDLARSGVKLALADPGVPVGAYTVQMLAKLAADPAYGSAFKGQVLDNVVSHEDNVRQVLTRVQLGEVDAGVVYTTDAQAANTAPGGTVPPVKTLAIPTPYNVIALYYIAPIKGAPHAAAAQAWISYILSEAGQATMAKYGFVRAGGP